MTSMPSSKVRRHWLWLWAIAFCLFVIIDPIESLLLAEDEDESSDKCPCALLDRPRLWKKELTARWMVHSLDWGVLTTISSRIPGNNSIPFGNVYSFVDGPCSVNGGGGDSSSSSSSSSTSTSTGTPYFYGTYMDQSFQDMQANAAASLVLSEAALASVCSATAEVPLKACTISNANWGDPENPVCARLVLTGHLLEVAPESDEYVMAQAAFFQRHPQMPYWPKDHHWVIVKLEIQDIWLIDYFGGASILSVEDYYAAELGSTDTDTDEWH
jgi:Pyridoxamine 5'-phosphate oxidase